MENLVLSPIDTDTLIDRIAAKTAELIQSRQTTQQEPQDDLITSKQAAGILKCSMVTIWRWERKGRITPYGIGGKKFFKRSEILQSIIKK